MTIARGHEALQVAEGRASEFFRSLDVSMVTTVQKELHKARVTIMEGMLLDACVESLTDASDARATMNWHITQFRPGGIQVSDINDSLWKQVQLVSRGMPLQ